MTDQTFLDKKIAQKGSLITFLINGPGKSLSRVTVNYIYTIFFRGN